MGCFSRMVTVNVSFDRADCMEPITNTVKTTVVWGRSGSLGVAYT